MTYTVEEAARLLGCGRQLAYELIRRDEFPVPVIRLGRVERPDGSVQPRRIVVPRGPLDTLLATGQGATG
jgi:excisionase family DNA binding protein